MKVERFDFDRHYASYAAWNRFFDQPALEPRFLPPTGFVVENVALGFLYLTDSKLAWIENLSANPVLPRETRTQGLDLVVTAIADEARARGYEVLIGYTTVKAVVDRALRLGFTTQDEQYHMVTKLL